MATRIFLSNKDTWGNDIETAIDEAKEAFAAAESHCRTWTCGNVKAIQVGDKAYFKRVGSEPRGFFARGRVVAAEKEYQLRLTASEYEELSEAYDIEVYNSQLMITYEWDSVVDYDKPLEISWLRNKPEFNGAFFDFLGSGGSFREEYVELLDRHWEKHVLTMSSLGHGASKCESGGHKPIEKNLWIQYHDYEQMDSLPEGLPGCDSEIGMSTNKRSVLNAEGDAVFLIVGIGDPKRYYFWSNFIVERVERVVCESGGFTYNAFGNNRVLNPPQLLNSKKFYEFQHFCRNFELGYIKIKNSPYLDTLKHLAEKYKPQNSDSHSWKGTEKFYNYVLHINSSDACAYFGQGFIHVQLGDIQAAIEDYSQAIRIAPDFADAYNHRGLAYFGSGNLEKAIQDCSQAIRLEPDFADAYHNRGLIRYIQGDKQEAIEDYNQAIHINPNDAEAYLHRGMAHSDLENYQGAIQDYNQALNINPNYAAVYYNRGIAHFGLENDQTAIEDYTKALEIDPDFADAYRDRGLARAEIGDKQGAIEDYTQVIRINPNDAEAYLHRGIAHSDLENYQGAIQDYNQALSINPNYAEAYYNRGIAHFGLEDDQTAIEDYTKALEIDPEFAAAYHTRGFARAEINDTLGAVEDLRKAADLYYQKEMMNDYKDVLELIQNLVLEPEEALTDAQELADTDGTFNPVNIEDARKRAERSIVLRRGQSEFRRSLLEAYKGHCAITGCDAKQALEAAHIIPYSGDNTNHPSNGLLLRTDIHTLFDLHLITVDPETMKVLVAPSLHGTYYSKFDGRELPEAVASLLSTEALKQHHNQCGW